MNDNGALRCVINVLKLTERENPQHDVLEILTKGLDFQVSRFILTSSPFITVSYAYNFTYSVDYVYYEN